MPTVDFTLEDLKQIFATKEDLAGFATKEDLAGFATKEDLREAKEDMRQGFGSVMEELKKVKRMLDENLRAESGRLDRVQKRVRKNRKELVEHASDIAIHGGGQ